MQKRMRVVELIALSELAGGLLGLVTLSRAVVSYPDLGNPGSIATMYAWCLVAVIGSIGLLRRQRWGARLTLAVLIVQVPLWRAAGSIYEVLLGPRVVLGIFDNRPMLYAGFAAKLDLRLERVQSRHFVAINIFAVVAALIVWWAQRPDQSSGLDGAPHRQEAE